MEAMAWNLRASRFLKSLRNGPALQRSANTRRKHKVDEFHVPFAMDYWMTQRAPGEAALFFLDRYVRASALRVTLRN